MGNTNVDIFSTLIEVNKKNTNFYTSLSYDEKKAVSPFIIMRWMSGTSNAQQVYLINECVNPYVFSLSKHPILLWNLPTLSNIGKPQKYIWSKLPGKLITGKTQTIKCIKEFFQYSTAHAQDVESLLSIDIIIEMATQLGWQSDEITSLKREHKK